ncbi:MAG: hypothetical protein IH600_14685 [Bacteroidetes bacterium]|nr:hypothetical protein [Bacteroidota bacterium]
MFFRILLISIISWGIMKLYRILTSSRRRGPAASRPNGNQRSYDGRAVDAQFEEIDDETKTRSEG